MRRTLTKRFKKLSFSSTSSLDVHLSSPLESGSTTSPGPSPTPGTGSSESSSSITSSLPTKPLAPGDEIILPPGYHVTPSDLRALNELILLRYTLDASIWRLRKCRPRDKSVVLQKMQQADAVLAKIMAMVRAWDNPEFWEEEAEWERLREIKERLEREGKRVWEGNPPWKDRDS